MSDDHRPARGEQRPGPATTRRAASPADARGGRVGLAAGRASPLAVTAALAAAAPAAPLPLPATELPMRLLLVVRVQLVGVLLARDLEMPVLRRVWLTLLAATAVVMPVVGLQAAASRTPFTALTRGSAGFLLVATLAALVVLAGAVVVTALLAAEAPDQASLLFLPIALAVPSLLAAPVGLDERAALAALAEASAVAAGAAFVGWLLPPRTRPMVAPVALVGQFAVLWLLGFRPLLPPGSGAIVPILAGVLIMATVLATVFVPIAALIVRRFGQTMDEGASLGRERVPPTTRRPETRR
jgi:hypothetical protein